MAAVLAYEWAGLELLRIVLALTVNRNRKRLTILGVLAIGLAAALLHWQSRFRRVDVVICDIGCVLDDGIVLAEIPLVRHASEMPFLNSLVISERRDRNDNWVAMYGETQHGRPIAPFRSWFSQERMQNISEFAGFGYWAQNNQYNNRRPGRSIMLFMPVWAVVIVLCGIFSLIVSRRRRWSIRTMGVMVLVCALFIRLATLTD
ncbi:hypothetical protein Mal15_62570 [Stieleria maiorica]|uniref:Uncharacterized protein n=2 Tax=Stieleria maiorica TaxID=2795974 RepID=A0A5B9MLC1_9BACT|nr:hypothetical protein Mal15_62570 [Stieleria maiorica]